MIKVSEYEIDTYGTHPMCFINIPRGSVILDAFDKSGSLFIHYKYDPGNQDEEKLIIVIQDDENIEMYDVQSKIPINLRYINTVYFDVNTNVHVFEVMSYDENQGEMGDNFRIIWERVVDEIEGI